MNAAAVLIFHEDTKVHEAPCISGLRVLRDFVMHFLEKVLGLVPTTELCQIASASVGTARETERRRRLESKRSRRQE
jgi:hypothetical protein